MWFWLYISIFSNDEKHLSSQLGAFFLINFKFFPLLYLDLDLIFAMNISLLVDLIMNYELCIMN